MNGSPWLSDDFVMSSSPQLRPVGKELPASGPQLSHSCVRQCTAFLRPRLLLQRLLAQRLYPKYALPSQVPRHSAHLSKSPLSASAAGIVRAGGRASMRWALAGGFRERTGCKALGVECALSNHQPIVYLLIIVSQPQSTAVCGTLSCERVLHSAGIQPSVQRTGNYRPTSRRKPRSYLFQPYLLSSGLSVQERQHTGVMTLKVHRLLVVPMSPVLGGGAQALSSPDISSLTYRLQSSVSNLGQVI